MAGRASQPGGAQVGVSAPLGQVRTCAVPKSAGLPERAALCSLCVRGYVVRDDGLARVMRWRARRAARDVSVQGSGLSVARGSHGPHAPGSDIRGARPSLTVPLSPPPSLPPPSPHALARRALLLLRVRAARRRRPRRAPSSRSRSRASVATTITTTFTCVARSPSFRTRLLACAAQPLRAATRHVTHPSKSRARTRCPHRIVAQNTFEPPFDPKVVGGLISFCVFGGVGVITFACWFQNKKNGFIKSS